LELNRFNKAQSTDDLVRLSTDSPGAKSQNNPMQSTGTLVRRPGTRTKVRDYGRT